MPGIERGGRGKLHGSQGLGERIQLDLRRPVGAAAIGRERPAVGQRDLDAGRLRLLTQGVQRLDGPLVVAGLQRLDDVHARDRGDARGKAAQFLARMQHVRDDGHDHRERERRDGRRSDHDAELALDREVGKPTNQPDLQ